jgi:hypothetical protein
MRIVCYYLILTKTTKESINGDKGEIRGGGPINAGAASQSSLPYDLAEEDMMAEVDYAELQQRYGGRYVAQRNGEVVASAETYDELSEQLESAVTDWDGLIIEYVEPPGVVCVY